MPDEEMKMLELEYQEFLKGKEYTIFVDENPEYKIKPKCIKCHKCNRISYNEKDIENLYCGWCNKFHKIKGNYGK